MVDDERPDPELLLKQINGEQDQQVRGKLKIFFGYAAGVGKTYAMLQAAQEAKARGIDVVAGYIEQHTRPETMALLEGLEQFPVLEVPYRNIILKEFDIDGLIKRKPRLVLVDELAHTNAAGCRHMKRCQDVEELQRAGIDVYTTVNVQHIESLNDIVASITGVIVRERIPDSVFDNADLVELIDIEPKDLIHRLNQGKVYKEKQASRAIQHFFTVENLIALREIALRRTADRGYRIAENNKQVSGKGDYYTDEHILICLSSSPTNTKVIRTASRMARAFHGQFTALYVETPDSAGLSEANRKRLRDNLRLAEQMGARIATVYGDDIALQIAEYTRISGVSKVVLGRTANRRWFFPKQTFSEKLTDLAPNLDIYIIPDNSITRNEARKNQLKKKYRSEKLTLADTFKTIVILALASLLGIWFDHLGFSEANVITVYILSVLVTAIVTKRRLYSLVSSILSVLVFNFLFTDPRMSLEAYDAGYPVTFLIMFVAAFITGTLTTKVKHQAQYASRLAYRTGILLDTSRRLQSTNDYEGIINTTAEQMLKLLNQTIVFYPVKDESLGEPVIFSDERDLTDTVEYTGEGEKAVAAWVYKNNKHAGATTETLPGAKALYLAVRSNDTVFAVVGIFLDDEGIDSYVKGLLISMLNECALAMEKDRSDNLQKETALRAQQEQFRANLLRSISHDLRTPLTSISGNAGILIGNSQSMTEEKKIRLYTDIYDDSMWLFNLVENLLSVTRIENGTMKIHMVPEILDEVVTEALKHIDRRSTDYQIRVKTEDELILAKVDTRLMMQVFINIIDNAIKYTPVGGTIDISTRRVRDRVLVEIADNGPGIPDDAKDKLFDMFFTGNIKVADSRRGMGLGLSLCKSIIDAHGGTLSVRDNEPQGTVFSFALQAEEVNVHG